jgi:hypothetical protein
MPELGSSGSVRGALRNERPYRERDAEIGELPAKIAKRDEPLLLLVPQHKGCALQTLEKSQAPLADIQRGSRR